MRNAAALLLALALAAPALAQSPPPADPSPPTSDLRPLISDLRLPISDLRPLLASLRAPTAQDVEKFGRQLQPFLESGSFDDLAWLFPHVRSFLAACDAFPELRPYADWLRPRLDYLEVSRLVVRLYPTPPPPDPPVPSVPSQEIQQNRARAAGSREVWRHTLKDRPIPAAAVKLVPVLKKIFQAEGVPHELVWMAEVESSFNPRARSPAGAVGLFQFMPATAERFELQLTPADQREQPELSARAAARYLRFLHGRFGAWPLAIAAYNAGEGRVGRALEKAGATSFESVAPALPTETRLYVPKVLALIELREKKDPALLPPPLGGQS